MEFGYAFKVRAVVNHRQLVHLGLGELLSARLLKTIQKGGHERRNIETHAAFKFQKHGRKRRHEFEQAGRRMTLQFANDGAAPLEGLLSEAISERDQDRVRSIKAPLHWRKS